MKRKMMPKEPTPPDEVSVDDAVAAAEGQLGDEFETEEAEEAAAPSTPPPPEEDPLDREVPTGKLSGYWKNKAAQSGQPIRFRDLVEGASGAEDKIRQQGERANSAQDELRVARAQLQVMQEMLGQMRTPQPQARQYGYEDAGIDNPEEEMLRNPGRFGNVTADIAARRARAEIDPRIQNVEQTVGSVAQRLDVLDVRNASEQARTEMNVEPQVWQAAGRFLWAAAGADPRTPKNSDSWKDAWRGLEEVFPRPEPRTTLPKEGIVRGNPSGSSRPTPVTTNAKPKQRVRGLVSAVTAEAIKAGLDPEVAREIEQRTEEKLQRREARE